MSSFLRCPTFITPALPPLRPRAKHSTARKAPTATAGIVLAPGQGAQYAGMAQSWRDASPAAATMLKTADDYISKEIGRSLDDLLQDGATLSRTDMAQPAIFATSMACWAGMKELGFADEEEVAVTAGLSLGEYTALTIGGAMRFEDALRLVTVRGQAMQEAAESSDGGMIALIGASETVAMEVVNACKGDDVLVAANFNAPGQVVLSGGTMAVERASVFAKEERKLRVAKLDVAGAFHSPLMEGAAEKLSKVLEDTSIGLPNVPILSNVTGKPHVVGEIRNMLVKQLTSSVRWADCCDYIRREYEDGTWMEVAPGRTLMGMMRKIDRKIKVQNFDSVPVKAE